MKTIQVRLGDITLKAICQNVGCADRKEYPYYIRDLIGSVPICSICNSEMQILDMAEVVYDDAR